MKREIKKVLSLILVFGMLLSLPGFAYAAETAETETEAAVAEAVTEAVTETAAEETEAAVEETEAAAVEETAAPEEATEADTVATEAESVAEDETDVTEAVETAAESETESETETETESESETELEMAWDPEAADTTLANQPEDGDTEDQPFTAETGSSYFGNPAVVTLSDGTIIAAADAYWNSTVAGNGSDTIVSYTKDGETWYYSYANYLGDNGNAINSSSATFSGVTLATNGSTVWMLVNLYPGGVTEANAATGTGYDDAGHLMLSINGGSSYDYYVGDYSNGYANIYNTDGVQVAHYTVDESFYLYYDGVRVSNLFFADCNFSVVPTSYLYLTKSTDGGKTWGTPVILNDQVKEDDENAYSVESGLVLSNGRIAFACRDNADGKVSVIYSDDNGTTWQRSAEIDTQVSDAALVQADDIVYLFTNDGYYVSADNGATFGAKQSIDGIASVDAGIAYSEDIDGLGAILLTDAGTVAAALVQEDGSIETAYTYTIDGNITDIAIAELDDGSVAVLYGNAAGVVTYAEIGIEAIAAGAVIGSETDDEEELTEGNTVSFTDANGLTYTATAEGVVLASISVGVGDVVVNEDGSISIAYDIVLTDADGNEYTGPATVTLPVDEAFDGYTDFTAVVYNEGEDASDGTDVPVTLTDEASAAEDEAGDTEEAEAVSEEIAETEEAAAESGSVLSLEVPHFSVLRVTAVLTSENEADGTTESVVMYVGGTETVTITSETEITFDSTSGSIYSSDDNTSVIATYSVASSSYTKYENYTASSTTNSITSGNSYAIGNGTYYLAVDSSGTLSAVNVVDEYSLWKITSSGSNYTLYNEATGCYLTLSSSGSGPNKSYSLGTSSSSGTSFSLNNGKFKVTDGGTSYYISVSSSGVTYTTTSSSGASVYSVTVSGSETTTYTYVITFTGSSSNTGTGSETIGGTTYEVTVKTKKTFTSGTQSINLSYGWHIANIESVTRTSSGQGVPGSSTGDTTTGYAAVTASQNALNSLYGQSYLTAGDTNVYGWDEDIYGEYDEDGNYDLHVTVYGSDDEVTWTEIDMTQSTGTTGSGTDIRGAYDGNTIYDYDYIMIVPDDGYYVSQLVAACNDTTERQTTTFSGVTTVESYMEVYGSEYLGVYGVGCSTMGSGNSFEAGYEPTAGTSIVLDMKTVLARHYEAGNSLGAEDPYMLLIELAEIPTPLYVEYEAGDGDGYIDADAIVDTSSNYYWAESCTDGTYYTYSTSDEKQNSVSFVLSKAELQELGYQYQVLNPSVTEYTKDGVTYYFTGWAVTYYTTATGTYDGTIDGESGYYYTSDAVTIKQYPYLSGELDMVSSNIEYGSNTSIYLFTHVKFVAQWTTTKLNDVEYVVDFGLPVELDVIAQCTANDSSFTWSISSIGTNPTYGTAVANADGTITYTPTEVIRGVDSMTVRLNGKSSSRSITAVVNVTIYPATTVYYEEGFATYGESWSVTGTGNWSATGSAVTTAQQTHIASSTTSYNNYNYDDAYVSGTGSAKTTTTSGDALQFTFTGDGVDIFANCDSGSGIVVIKVSGENGVEKTLTVNMADTGTYASGETAYNTPIASVSGLSYGSHTVTIYLYSVGTTGFNFDGFRVYDTIDESSDETAKAVYTADNEDNPSYYELRNKVLAELGVDTSSSTYEDDLSKTLAQVYTTSESLSGAVLTYNSSSYTVEEVQSLLDYGPKNELYLKSDMSVTFKINTTREVQIGLRSVTGASVTYTISDGTNTNTYTTSSSVDMFYDLQAKSSGDATETTYTITVTGGGILSITDIKVSDYSGDIFGTLTADEVVYAITGTTYDSGETEQTEETEETEPEVSYAFAELNIYLLDASGNEVAATAISEVGVEGGTAAFTASAILAAAEAVLPDGYSIDTGFVSDQSVAYGSSADVTIIVNKLAASELTVNLVDYSAKTVASTTLTSEAGIEGEAVTFAASDILAAVETALPSGYAIVSESSITDVTSAYGESASVSIQIGKVATLVITFQSGLIRKTTVGTVTLTKVQTSSGSSATFSSSEIKSAVPSGYKVLVATSSTVSYGSTATKTVTVY